MVDGSWAVDMVFLSVVGRSLAMSAGLIGQLTMRSGYFHTLCDVWSAAVVTGAEVGTAGFFSGRMRARSTGQRPVAAAQITQMEM